MELTSIHIDCLCLLNLFSYLVEINLLIHSLIELVIVQGRIH